MAHTNTSQSVGNVGRIVQPTALYSSLAPDQTRLLTIFPASGMDDNIFSELTNISLGEIAVSGYEALSYTWGSNALTHSISVNGLPITITENPLEAIRHLRYKKKKRSLWVDAICINQGDLAERSRQVLHMKQIFSAVDQVIIWLGKEVYSSAGPPGLPIGDLKELSPKQQRAAASGIFERQWWLRSWTVQEFLHAKRSVFVCGSLMLSWIELEKLLLKLENASGTSIPYNHIRAFLRSKNSHKNDLLKTIISDFGHSQATDPRDKVFAFLGIAKDGHVFVPDYMATVQKVYTDLVEMYIEKDHHIDIICTHHRGYGELSLPSWVPDWSTSRSSAHNWTIDFEAMPVYSAGFMLNNKKNASFPLGLMTPTVTRSVVSTTLNVCGADIGLISEIACSIDHELFDSDDWMQELRSWKPKDIKSGTYLNGESNFRALCRTLVADLYGYLRYNQIGKSNEKWCSSKLKQLESEFRGVFAGHVNESKSLSIRLQRSLYNSRFARLSSGHMALVPKASMKGDHICVLSGGSVPVGLRVLQQPLALPTNPISESTKTYQMVGPCYVHGVMDGEMFEKIDSTFIII